MQAKLTVLQNWVANAHPVRQAVQSLAAKLASIKPLMEATAQRRCVEESTIFEAHWYTLVLTLGTLPLENQVRNIRNASQTVLADLGVLLQQRRGSVLTMDERRKGIFYDQGGFAIRRLEPQEIEAGIASS